MKFKQSIVIVLLAMLGLTGITAANAASAPSAVTNATTPPVMYISGAIRCTAGVYSVIDDSGHNPYGFGTVTTMSDRVRVNYTASIAQVSSSQVTADETYADNNVVPGASVGLDHTDILLYVNGVKTSPASLCYSGSNIWITGWKA